MENHDSRNGGVLKLTMGQSLLITSAIMFFISLQAYAQPSPKHGLNGSHSDVTCSEGQFNPDEIIRRQKDAGYNVEDMSQWNSSTKAPKAIVFMLHGISMRAGGMKDLSDVMQSFGFDVFRATLWGHGGNEDEIKKSSRAKWLDEVLEGYCIARERADQLHVPLYFAGFSLGALLTLDIANGGFRQKIEFEKMVLLAPPISLRWKILALKTLGPLSFLPMPVKVFEFKAFIDSYDATRAHGIANMIVPTLVFLDPKDELISQDGFKKQLVKNNLNWSVINVDNSESKMPHKAHHRIDNSGYVGQAQWQIMVQEMAKFLNGPVATGLKHAQN